MTPQTTKTCTLTPQTTKTFEKSNFDEIFPLYSCHMPFFNQKIKNKLKKTKFYFLFLKRWFLGWRYFPTETRSFRYPSGHRLFAMP
jgi:hypothetical protein